MVPDTFKALRAEPIADNSIVPVLREMPISSLPDNEVLIRVHYSSLNYKDALSATGNRGITRKFPHTPGIDSCGTVVASASPDIKKGDRVLVFGRDLGMNTPGGFGQFISVPAEWVMPMPGALGFRESMIIGTAGFTAALGIYKMEQNGQQPENGPVLVTGAGGGLGGLAINILSRIGYEVIAATGKTHEIDYFKKIGAAEIIDRGQVDDRSGKLLLSHRWAGVVETVGGNILSTAIRACKRHGNIAVCGNALSHELNISVYPFILNGVNLLGVDSATSTREERGIIWGRLANKWYPNMLQTIGSEIKMEQLPEKINLILKGQIRGRVVVNME